MKNTFRTNERVVCCTYNSPVTCTLIYKVNLYLGVFKSPLDKSKVPYEHIQQQCGKYSLKRKRTRPVWVHTCKYKTLKYLRVHDLKTTFISPRYTVNVNPLN